MADRVRERAREAGNQLHAKNVQVVMITSDAEAVAKTVAQDLGIDRYYARVLPEDKVKIISKLKQAGATASVPQPQPSVHGRTHDIGDAHHHADSDGFNVPK